MCCRLISYNLKIAATGHFNTFFPPFSFHFKHENLRTKVLSPLANYPGFNLLPRVVPFLVFLAC